MADRTMTENELVRSTGTSPGFVRRLVELGVVPRREGEPPFQPGDIHRVRLAEAFERSGIPLEAIGAAIDAGRLSFDFVDRMFSDAAPLSTRTFREVSDEVGIPLETLTRLYAMWGLPRPAPDDKIREDDAPTFREWKSFFPSEIMNEELLTQGARLYGEATSLLADMGMTLYRTYVEGPMLAAGATPQDVLDAASSFDAGGQPIMERQLIWLLRRKIEHDAFQLIVEQVEGAVEATGRVRRASGAQPAIAFVDLSGYTALTEKIGDQAAAQRAAVMGTLLQELAHARGGRVVKLLGDGAMLHFPDPAQAVRSGLEIVRRVDDAGLPPARVGIAAGPVVFREGDFYGRVVNLASRVMGRAGPREVLVDDQVVAAGDGGGIVFTGLGAVELKGIAEPVPLHRAVAG